MFFSQFNTLLFAIVVSVRPVMVKNYLQDTEKNDLIKTGKVQIFNSACLAKNMEKC